MTGLHAEDCRILADAASDPRALLAAVRDVAERRLGAVVVSAMRFERDTMTVRRVYSSHTIDYPAGGAKPKKDTDWGRHVLIEGRLFIADGADAIRATFPDAAMILELGARALVNVPLVVGGAVIGTLNVLIPRERWAADEIAIVRALGVIATVGVVGAD